MLTTDLFAGPSTQRYRYGMHHDNIPLHLYRYRSLAGPYGRSSIENAIVNSKLYWQCPKAFNDPFDCNPVLFFGENAEQRRQFVRRASKQAHNFPRHFRRSRKRTILLHPKQHEEMMISSWQEWMQESSVACFSEVHDHPLMWAHYADSHRGICLIFREMLAREKNWFAFPVSYSENRPRVNLASYNNELQGFKDSLLNKSIHWSYEKEHRLIGWRNPSGYYDFPRQCLEGIIFGAKTSSDDIKFIENLCRLNQNMKLYRMNLAGNEFKLEMSPYLG